MKGAKNGPMRNGKQQQCGTDRKAKWARVRDTGQIGVLDLFAGCGGMSLGFLRERFSIVGAVEVDPLASLSHALNFHRSDPPEIRERHRQPRDITATNPIELQDELGLQQPASPVDVIVGGPSTSVPGGPGN